MAIFGWVAVRMLGVVTVVSVLALPGWSQGAGTTVVGDGTPGGSDSQLRLPTGIAMDLADNLYVADTYNHRVLRLTPNGDLTTVAGSGGNGNGPNQLNFPRSVAVDRDGNLFIADSYNHRVQKISPAGVVMTVAGAGGQGSGLGQLNYPRGLAVDQDGSVYIADTYNSRVQKVTSSGVATTVAGLGGNGNGANQLNFPPGVAVDREGNVYVADMLNQRVQKVTPKGIVLTVLGGIEPGTGPRQLRNPGGVAVDGSGSLYVIDTNNDRVQMVLPENAVLTVAGNGGQGTGESQLFSPYATAVDSFGNLYVADTNNHRVQRIRDVMLPREPELWSAATNRLADGSPNLLMRVSHPVECAVTPEVIVGGYRAEVRVLTGKFVQFAIPEALEVGSVTEVYVTCRGVSMFPPFSLAVLAASPGIFTGPDLLALAESADGRTKIDAKTPARAGEIITMFGTGLGLLKLPDANGLRWTMATVTVRVGDLPAEVLYSGAAPGQSNGVQQINLRVPAGLTAGRQPISIATGSMTSWGSVYLVVR